MAKKPATPKRVITEVSFKDPSQVIHLKNLGFKLTAENLTVERFEKLIQLNAKFEQYFNVKSTTKKQDEQSQVEAKG